MRRTIESRLPSQRAISRRSTGTNRGRAVSYQAYAANPMPDMRCALTASLTFWIADNFGWTTSFFVALGLCVVGAILWAVVGPNTPISDRPAGMEAATKQSDARTAGPTGAQVGSGGASARYFQNVRAADRRRIGIAGRDSRILREWLCALAVLLHLAQ